MARFFLKPDVLIVLVLCLDCSAFGPSIRLVAGAIEMNGLGPEPGASSLIASTLLRQRLWDFKHLQQRKASILKPKSSVWCMRLKCFHSNLTDT